MIQKYGVVYENMKKVHKAILLNDNVLLVLNMLEQNTFIKTDGIQYKYVDQTTERMVSGLMNSTQLEDYINNMEITDTFKRLANDYADIIIINTVEENEEWIYSSNARHTQELVLLSYHRRIIMHLNNVMLKKKYFSKDSMTSMNYMNNFIKSMHEDIKKELRRDSMKPRETTQTTRNTRPRQVNNNRGVS